MPEFTVHPETYIKTGHPEFDDLYPKVKSFLEMDRLDISIDGTPIRGYRTPDTKSIWIRDYSDMLRGVRYFETDLKSTISHFAETQSASGRIFDYFTTFPEKLPCEKENWTKYVRVPVEADVEFRFVKAAFLAWQAACDDEWLLGLLPNMEKALQYILTHPWRIDKPSGLIKRPYTIDTWDFAYTAGKHDWLQFQINDDTYWGLMHGDNSGYYEAFRIMARLYLYFSQPDKAAYWRDKAEQIKTAMNRICWNGSFYTHFVKLNPVDIPGVDESRQLSLSNPMAVNRGVTDQTMAASIIHEYQKRKEQTNAFAEWFSIDPPFPDGVFGDEKLIAGAYINGGIMPLVGGELALAALENGFESYGADILRQYFEMIDKTGETYLWYFPDGSPSTVETSTSPDAEPTDGWGSSAMLMALMEGLAGIKDQLKGFEEIVLSPRWAAAGVKSAEVQNIYPASGKTISYKYRQDSKAVHMDIQSESSNIQFNILLPSDRKADQAVLDGRNIDFFIKRIQESSYLKLSAAVKGKSQLEIKLRPLQ